MSFGKQLKHVRTMKNMTQKELALAVHAKHNSVSNWENDISKPDISTLETICNILETTPNYLMEVCKETLSPEEEILMNQYRLLDEHGRKLLQLILTEEYNRCKSIAPKDSETTEMLWAKMGIDTLLAKDPDAQEEAI